MSQALKKQPGWRDAAVNKTRREFIRDPRAFAATTKTCTRCGAAIRRGIDNIYDFNARKICRPGTGCNARKSCRN